MDCLLCQQCVRICGGRNTSLRGSWWVMSSSVLQQVLVFPVGSSCHYWVREFWQDVKGEIKDNTFYTFECPNHLRNPAFHLCLYCFQGEREAGICGVHKSVLSSSEGSLPPHVLWRDVFGNHNAGCSGTQEPERREKLSFQAHFDSCALLGALLLRLMLRRQTRNGVQHSAQLTRPFILLLQDNGFSVPFLHAVANGLLKTVQYFWSPSAL